MTDRINEMLRYFITEKQHHQYRTVHPDKYQLASEYAELGLPDYRRAQRRLSWMLEAETAVVFPKEKISLIRTVTSVPEIYTKEEWDEICTNYNIHEQGKVCNINPEYTKLLAVGTRAKRMEIQARIEEKEDSNTDYLRSMIDILDSLEAFAAKYADAARKVGNKEVASVFSRIPYEQPRTFHEALQFLRLLHYGLWCSFNYHNTFGRFDQYMYPYFKNDISNGVLTEDEALELLEEFFISCNKDSDLYPGMQQGDNGQSMVLGGKSADGTDGYNRLSALCLKASLNTRLIDPKINLRVDRDTPLERYVEGSELTKQGLGFPQYSNDDVVTEALQRWGYDREDAYSYVVAACWEFIVPGKGMDIPNINGLSFAQVISSSVENTEEWTTFDELMNVVKENIFTQANELIQATKNIYMEPAPLMSLMMDGCVENGRDISLGGKYNNYGFHGTGLSTAVDSLAAIRKYIFEESLFTKGDLHQMLLEDFENHNNILSRLRFQSPKMGNDDDHVDALAVQLLDWFADALEGCKNDRGGMFRPGTGSAMYYIWHSKEMSATPDGRKRGEPFACNYSPSLFSRCRGPVSIIRSFAKPHLVRVANGGPLTMELHDSMFRNSESTYKVAQFVKSFIDMGGHQLQINAVNRDKLIDAKVHPENYRGLIVRVWGWSGYFVELDEEYQDHIIKRMEHSIT